MDQSEAILALVAAIQAQAEAIDRLAQSNMAIVDLLTEGMAGEERPADTYMDGTPK